MEPGNEESLKEYLYGHDLLDIVQDFGPLEVPASEFIGFLRKIPSRLYSIASSSKANPDEVHLTIGTVRYEAHGRQREGVCSVECAERLERAIMSQFMFKAMTNFRLPEIQRHRLS